MENVKYQVWCEGKMLCEGSRIEVSKAMGKSHSYISNHIANSSVIYKEKGHQYEIRMINSDEDETKKEEEFQNVLYHLKYDGNTIVVEEPTELIKRLNSMGIEVSVEHYDRSKTHKVFKNEFIVEDWVLTRIGGQHAT